MFGRKELPNNEPMKGGKLRPRRSPRDCEVPGCGREYVAKGFCRSHYMQNKRGTVIKPVKPSKGPEIVGPGIKRCTGCGEIKPFSGFYKNGSRGTKLQSMCKPCFSVKRKIRSIESHGLTVELYHTRLESQGGGCAICGTGDPGKRRFSVDHDHSCCPGSYSCGDCIRGLLCNACNQGLGMFKDNSQVMRVAISYLEGRSAS